MAIGRKITDERAGSATVLGGSVRRAFLMPPGFNNDWLGPGLVYVVSAGAPQLYLPDRGADPVLYP